MMGSNDKPQDQLLRDIDRVLDLSDLREHLAPYYSHTGRPSVDRLQLRGLSGAKDEFPLTATARNLRRMAKVLGTGPPGDRGMAAA
jgi:hypothetical protein